MQQKYLSQNTVIEKMDGQFDFKATCTKLPIFSYPENVELKVLDKEIISLDFPMTDQWNTAKTYRKIKYKLHQ